MKKSKILYGILSNSYFIHNRIYKFHRNLDGEYWTSDGETGLTSDTHVCKQRNTTFTVGKIRK
jgi:hypothetical protein